MAAIAPANAVAAAIRMAIRRCLCRASLVYTQLNAWFPRLGDEGGRTPRWTRSRVDRLPRLVVSVVPGSGRPSDGGPGCEVPRPDAVVRRLAHGWINRRRLHHLRDGSPRRGGVPPP